MLPRLFKAGLNPCDKDKKLTISFLIKSIILYSNLFLTLFKDKLIYYCMMIKWCFLIGLCNAFICNNFVRPYSKTKLFYKPSDTIQEIAKTSGPIIGKEWTYSDLINSIKDNNLEAATVVDKTNSVFAIDKNHGSNILADNIHLIKTIPSTTDLIIDKLATNNINFDIFTPPTNLLNSIPFGFQIIIAYLLISFVISAIRANSMMGMQGFNMNNPLNAILPKKELVDTELVDVSFKDVAGCDEAKNELVEVVDFLKEPDKFVNAGAIIPKGILLEGDPGTGKTLLARAIAGEAGVNFISASGSEFIEMFVGVGASRVRNLFKTAKDNSPCVIFIDEIDAIGRQRGAGFNSGNDEREQTLNQILTNMDGFEKTSGIIVVAATNRADILDSALVRPGRFDRKVNVPLPDISGRKEISKIHFNNKNLSDNVSFDTIAELTGGFSGADIANLANEAAILSVRYNDTLITQKSIMDAYEKITIGLPSASENRDDEVMELVAYHEAGHTAIALLFNEFFDVKKVTINSNKGGAGGYTLFTAKERYQTFPTKKYMLANLLVALGGRAAEVVLYNSKNITDNNNYNESIIFDHFTDLDITTGASADLKQANSIARQYITQFGFSDNIGLFDSSYGNKPFLGRDMAMGGDKTSEESKKVIDAKIQHLVKFAYVNACNILSDNKNVLDDISYKLIKEKTISSNDIGIFNVTYF
jgi:cell division protease FtsH